jgi:RNA polymerase sigma-70 factor, ECF subfamily
VTHQGAEPLDHPPGWGAPERTTTERRIEDREIIERAQAGDRRAYGELVKRHQRRVYVTALQLVRNPADAEDLAQETFVKAFRAIPRFDFRSDFFTWLYRITVNTALNFLGQAHRARSVSLDEDTLLRSAVERLSDQGDDPRTQAEWRQICSRVLEAMEELSPDLRVTLVLHAVQGMNQKEVAEVMDCAEGTIAWRISEARRLLRLRLKHVLDGERHHDDELSRDPDAPVRLP